jgi:tetratricopeptide (TPR) repeat protein
MGGLFAKAAALVLVLACGQAAGQEPGWLKARVDESFDLQSAGRYADAERLLLDLIQEMDRQGVNDARLASVRHTAGKVQLLLAKHAEAERNLQRAIHLFQESGHAESLDIVLALTDLSTLYDACGQHGRANRLQRRAMLVCERKEWRQTPECLRVLLDHATSLLLQRKHERSEDVFRSLLDRLGDGSREHAIIKFTAHEHLAVLLQRVNRLEEAAQQARLSIALVEGVLGAEHPLSVKPLLVLAGIEVARGRTEEAEKGYQRALRIVEATLGPENALYGVALQEYAASLRKMKRKDEARKLDRMGKSILDRSGWLGVERGVVDISDLR